MSKCMIALLDMMDKDSSICPLCKQSIDDDRFFEIVERIGLIKRDTVKEKSNEER